jgi:hypothetical protein
MASDDNTRQQHDIVEPEEELDNEDGAETVGGTEGLEEPKNSDDLMKDFTGNDPHQGHGVADEVNEDEKAQVGQTGPSKKKKLKPVLQ